ncbi:helix-turn-helix domain-containing protein [Maribacter ulvicola]|uniref:DNA-binding transcriptional regulator, XRE-family HTH domain n=1 Tax=Maribacter ulvicola TaxID=228959 RepID=A0A1N6YPS4_9FLAO|nr:helix-turn-helix transcriptional regulator [Maribacter ulvicola]SIR16643.1 DNA-binding transcriptional regulator, XRE-family HTH domain [Maribacter ulvicola]
MTLILYRDKEYINFVNMLNTASFLLRLKTILEHNDLSSAAFADLVDVQRSSISHLLNGRNKPSLEFIMKVNDAFPEVDLQWLLYGSGTFPKTKKKTPTPTSKNVPTQRTNNENEKRLERIIMFYTDGTFKTYTEL